MNEFIIWFFVFYVWHALGITVGYHRLLSHRSFACPKLIEYFFVLGGYLTFQGSPIWWATIHRAHHRHVDTPLDPHSPLYGFWNAHMGWLMKTGYPDHIDPARQAKDLINDPIYQFLEQGGHWYRAHVLVFVLGFAFKGLLWLCFGWQVALASLVSTALVYNVPLMLNVVCHLPKLGYKNYKLVDDSVNVWWVALLAMGEGWHNNHHAAPGSARTGIRSGELDASWLTIKILRRLRLAWQVNDSIKDKVMNASPKPALRRRHVRALPAVPVVVHAMPAVALRTIGTAPRTHSQSVQSRQSMH